MEGTQWAGEQARHPPSAAFKLLVAAIEMAPEFMEQAAREAERRWPAQAVSEVDSGRSAVSAHDRARGRISYMAGGPYFLESTSGGFAEVASE